MRQPPNHVIINEYDPGAGLTPHTDGLLYACRVATLSLMSDVVMELHSPVEAAVRCEDETRLARLRLRRRSLNVLDGDAYRAFHGIRSTEQDVVSGGRGEESAAGARADQGVANASAAGVAGERLVVRRMRRVSIVFVSKLPDVGVVSIG